MREHLAVQYEAKLIKGLTELESEARQRDQEDAIAWHKRSRVWWLTIEDGLTRYFFSHVKGRWAKDILQCIKREDSLIVEDEDGILEEATLYYSEIFTCDEKIWCNGEERQSVLILFIINYLMLTNSSWRRFLI